VGYPFQVAAAAAPAWKVAAVAAPKVDPLQWLVKEFGTWLGGAPQALGPVLVLLDGIIGRDRFAPVIADSCRKADVCVASFDVSGMAAHTRRALYASLDRLRSATPLAVSNLIMTLDGSHENARGLAMELRELCELGKWQEREPAAMANIPDFNLGVLRHFYVSRGAEMMGVPTDAATPEGRQSAFANRLTGALSAFTAAESTRAAPRLPFEKPEEQRTRFLNAAHRLMGEIVCYDATPTRAMQCTFAGSAVNYMPNAGALTYGPDRSPTS